METKPKRSKFLLYAIGGVIVLFFLCIIITSLFPGNEEPSQSTTQSATEIQTQMPTELVAVAEPTEANTPAQTAAPTMSPRCVPASEGQLERIRAGIEGVQESNYIKSAWAVKSNDFENVWMVAAKIYGPSMEDGAGPGVWAISGELDNPRITMSVDGYAKEFSDWPDGSTTDAAITGFEDGVEEAKACANIE